MATRPDGWTIRQEILMLRRQMLIHSCLYYELDESIITDHQWQDRANRLARIQTKYKNPKVDFFDEEFEGWDGSSGYHLPLRHPWVVGKARQILELHRKQHG